MKANLLAYLAMVLLWSAAALHMPAQDSEATSKWFEEVKAKAEKGEAEAQERLAHLYFNGWGTKKMPTMQCAGSAKLRNRGAHPAKPN